MRLEQFKTVRGLVDHRDVTFPGRVRLVFWGSLDCGTDCALVNTGKRHELGTADPVWNVKVKGCACPHLGAFPMSCLPNAHRSRPPAEFVGPIAAEANNWLRQQPSL